MNINEILKIENLLQAWEKVESKKVTQGLDELSISEFAKNLSANLNDIVFEIKNKIYRPVPVKMVKQNKNIAIASVKDKVIQNAILNVLSKKIKDITIETNYGYISGKSIYQAIDHINHCIDDSGICYFYQCDIQNFFDNIDHSILLDKISNIVDDKHVIWLIQLFVKCDYLYEDKIYTKEKGIILGNPISPVLSNLYLCDTDKKLAAEFPLYVRYSDDILIGSKFMLQEKDIHLVIDELDKIKLNLNKEKSKFVDLKKGFRYLGHDFIRKECSFHKPLSVSILKQHIENDRYEDILKYIWDVTDIPPNYFDELIECIKVIEKRKYIFLLLILIVRNGVPIQQSLQEYIINTLGISNLEKIQQMISNADNLECLISNCIQYFIQLKNYELAEQINTIESLAEDYSYSSELSVQYKQAYIKLFQGRKFWYARGYCDIYGKRYYYKINRDFSEIELKSMLEDRYSIGIYPLNEQNKSKLFVFDIDIDKKLLLEYGEDNEFFKSMLTKARNYAFEIRDSLHKMDVKAYVEFSGYKGYHVWIFFSELIDVLYLRETLLPLVNLVEKPNGVNLEYIPAMDYSEDEVIKLPLSYHEISNRQAVFVNEQGEAISNQLEFITNIQLNSINILEKSDMIFLK